MNELVNTAINEDEDFTDIMAKDYWEGIAACKERYINYGEDPRNNKYVREEVAESWIRSRNFGVSQQPDFSSFCLSKKEFNEIREKNKHLIEIATHSFNTFMTLATSSGYSMELFDKNGVFLIGSHLSMSKINGPGIVWNEKTTGTIAHSMAIYYKKPYQLIGPENYLKILKTTLCSSAPILNENGEVLGALALIQDLGEHPWELNLHRLHSHSLGWIHSLAVSIENQVKLYLSNDNLKAVNDNLEKANQILKVSLEFTDEGVVSIEPDGTIIRTNRVGSRILHLDPETSEKHNIFNYLSDRSSFIKTLQGKKNVDYVEEFIRSGQEEKPYLISVQPFLKQETKELDLAILRFSQPEKINALVASRSGASAKLNFDDIVGESEKMLMAKKLAKRFALSRENLLILGESGTGKELFAQAIHNMYNPHGPFIAVNCAAMPRNLIESELFGYESGAFTGAEKNGRPGKIELANSGTLFLDEIGDMPYELQAVLLRVLQDKMVMRLGGKHYLHVNFRLITATNKNPLKLVQEKLFREDLYFRLSVLKVVIPPLRERDNDILLLAEYFMKNYADKMGWPLPSIAAEVSNCLLEYDWPGNVRQLENAIIYAANLAEDKIIDISHLPQELFMNKEGMTDSRYEEKFAEPLKTTKRVLSIKESEKEVILKALSLGGDIIAEASDILGVSKSTLYRKLKEHHIPIKSNR